MLGNLKTDNCGRTYRTRIFTSAYEIIGNLNKELEEQGYLTLRGKVPTKYFVKRFYGVEDTCEIPQEEGKEWFHA